MSTCKDCIHERVCFALIKSGLPYDDLLPAEAFCMTFRNKADYAPVVRCENCKHSCELAPHSEISPYYRHCNLWRGEETKNVWHKYKKYYADYSIVEPTDFCSYGEKESEVRE